MLYTGVKGGSQHTRSLYRVYEYKGFPRYESTAQVPVCGMEMNPEETDYSTAYRMDRSRYPLRPNHFIDSGGLAG